MSDPLDLFFETKKEEKPNQTKGYMDAIKGRLTDEQISNGYEEKYGEPPVLPEKNGVEINVMGQTYEGEKKIEITGGDIFIDGEKSGTMPNTSGVSIKVIRGKHLTGGCYTVVKC